MTYGDNLLLQGISCHIIKSWKFLFVIVFISVSYKQNGA